MSLKTKADMENPREEAGMYMKIKHLPIKSGNVVEKKGC
jgi:hypothetical protein